MISTILNSVRGNGEQQILCSRVLLLYPLHSQQIAAKYFRVLLAKNERIERRLADAKYYTVLKFKLVTSIWLPCFIISSNFI